MDLEDLLTALDIRQAHIDLTVKAARTQQGLIQNVSAVGGRHDDDAVVGFKAVHFHQQLVQGLLAFIVAAAQTGTALTAHSIDLINEDDAGHGLLCLIEQVTHAGCTHADVHFHKVRAGNGIEGHTGLACAGAGQQGLAGAGGPTSSTPWGMRAPRVLNFSGLFRNSTTSFSSSFSSSSPATSAKVAVFWFSCSSFTLLCQRS